MTDIYRALSDPIRRKILQMLANRSLSQTEIVEQFTISQPAITKHLKILKEEDLIYEERRGKYCYYILDRSVFESNYAVMKQEIERILDQKLHSLKTYLEEDEKHE